MNSASDLTFEEPANVNAATADDPAAHLDTFRAPDIDGETFAEDAPVMVGEDGEPMAGEIEPERMSREAFAAVFRLSFNMPGMMLPDFKPLGITEEKEEPFQEAADAAYDLCEMHFPGVLLSSNDTFAAVIRCVPFLMMQAGAVRAILIERRRAKVEAMKPANTNAEPQRAKDAENDPEQPATMAEGLDWMNDGEAA